MEVESNNLDVCPPSSPSLDLNTVRSRIGELRAIHGKFEEVPQLYSSECDELLKNTTLELESKLDRILSDTSDISLLSSKDLEEFLVHLKKELRTVEEDNLKAEEELEELSRSFVEDSLELESELEGLSCLLEFCESKGIENRTWHASIHHHSSSSDEDEAELLNPCGVSKFKIIELDHQIEKNKDTLKTLQDLDCKFRRLEGIEKIEDSFSCLKVVEYEGNCIKLEAIEKIEDSLSCLKVVDYEGNCIKLSLRTFIDDIESVLSLQKMEDLIEKPSEQNHELLLELVDGTMELKKVEIFPNDVYIGEVIDATKSFRQHYASLPVVDSRYSLEWFLRRVQDRIVLSTLRRFVVKSENKSRYSFDYLDRDEIIIAHMMGGIDALIKVAQGWPISDDPLDLINLKCSSNSSEEISLSFLCKVVELGNSLDAHLRQRISSFVDGIEGILLQQMRPEVQPEHITQK